MFGQKKQMAWFFGSSVHLEAVSRLHYIIDAGEQFGSVCGSDGCGRTRVLTRLREEIERTGKLVVSLNVAGLDDKVALAELVTSISPSARRNMAVHELVCLLRDEIAGRAHCGIHSVILIDDIHRALCNVDSFLRVLTALNTGISNTGSPGKLTVIAASDRQLASGLAVDSLLQVRLTPLDQAESREFVRLLTRRLGIAEGILSDNAIRMIHDLSRGNIGHMCRICDLLAVLHETTTDAQINIETISEMFNELSPRAVA